MHIVLVYPSPGIWGGIETQIVRMSHWLVSQGHQVTVVTAFDKHWGGLLPENVPCIALGHDFWNLTYYFRARRIWRSLGIGRPDVIKTFNWELRTCWIGYQLAIISGARAVAGYYAPRKMLLELPRDFYFRCFLHNFPSSARIFMSPEQIEGLQDEFGQDGQLWLLPVDSNRFIPAERRPLWGRIVSIGRLSKMKEYNLYMIDVVAELIRRGHNVTWTAYGTGEFEEEMRAMIRERNLEGAITMPGPIAYEQCRQVLSDAYVFVGMGTTIIEASLFGVPNVLAIAFDREGRTYGPVYRVPLGSVGDGRREPATLTVADEIERILKLTPEKYESECARVAQYAQPYESDVSMRHLMEILEAAPPPKRRLLPCIGNYFHGPRRRLTRIWRERVLGKTD